MRNNILDWVEAGPGNLPFRQAVHTILHAISITDNLKASMFMKGGVLLTIVYKSQRVTKDIDFSTSQLLSEFDLDSFNKKLNEGLIYAIEDLQYGLDCKIQKIEQKPPDRKDKEVNFPTIKATIGYAYKNNRNAHLRLTRLNSSDIVTIDYSLNESVEYFDSYEVEDNNTIYVYSPIELISEKYRAIIQQDKRNRIRGQDVYDLYYLLKIYSINLNESDKEKILIRLLKKSESRNLYLKKDAINNPDIINRSKLGYKNLKNLIDEELIDFDTAFSHIRDFYFSLPWQNQVSTD